MQLTPVTSKFNPGQTVAHKGKPVRIIAIRATSVVGRSKQRDRIFYDIDPGMGPEGIIGGVSEWDLKAIDAGNAGGV